VNKFRFIHFWAVGGALLLPPLGRAQTTPGSAATTAPKLPAILRAADGKPDLNGVYQGGSTKPGTWEEANQGVGVPGPGDPRNGVTQTERPSYTPFGAKIIQEDYVRRNIDSADAHCIPDVAMITVGLFPVQIFQNSQGILIIHEYMSAHRIIPYATKHPDDIEPTYLGDSIAHWDGDTLVIDTIEFKENLHNGGGGGRMHGDQLHMTERLTRTDYNTIKYDVVWDDPKTLTKPYNFHSFLMLRPGTRVQEYRCEENNLEPERFEELKKDESLFKRPQ
jgi:hypothetical protein